MLLSINRLGLAGLCLTALLTTAPPVKADWLKDYVSEVRVGVMDHDPELFTLRPEGDATKDDREPGFDVNAEVLFRSPDYSFFRTLFNPRPIFGVNINSEGATSMAYAGLDWSYQFDFGLFVEGSFGFAAHNGELSTPLDADGGLCSGGPPRWGCVDHRSSLGSRILFRESLELGYRFAGGHGLSAHVSHISNGSILADTNGGLDVAGIRYSYRFD